MTTPKEEVLVSATGLAMLLCTSYQTIKMLAAQERWHSGELPTPVEGPGRRRWRVKDIDAWLLENERHEWARN